MLITVAKAEYLSEYAIKLSFSNGETGVVDLKETIFKDHRKIFDPLEKSAIF